MAKGPDRGRRGAELNRQQTGRVYPHSLSALLFWWNHVLSGDLLPYRGEALDWKGDCAQDALLDEAGC